MIETPDKLSSASPLIVKIGGSLLSTPADYVQAASWIAEKLQREPTWVVISAAGGITDLLLSLSRELSSTDEIIEIQEASSIF